MQHYIIYISSISAYADLTPAGIDEDYKLAPLDDPDATQITEKNYGGLKAACEQVVEQTFGARQAVIRPRFRDVATTVRDLLAWHQQRSAEKKQKLRAGLTLGAKRSC